MSNPWDAPPFPRSGDFDDNLTYAGVGRVLSKWEMLEWRLGILYSTFSGKPENFGLQREYGVPNIFRMRFSGLVERANEYFRRKPDQNREGNFHILSQHIVGWADRRNEIAHGVVGEIQIVGFYREQLDFEVQHRSNFAVVPPNHTRRFHDPQSGEPLFAYTSVELLRFHAGIVQLVSAVQEFDLSLVPGTLR